MDYQLIMHGEVENPGFQSNKAFPTLLMYYKQANGAVMGQKDRNRECNTNQP